MLVKGIIRSMRPHQWTKNVLVFAAPAAAGVIRERDVALNSILAFVAFCLASSGTYLLNDAQDVESDRQHPTKRNRPIAAGIVPVPLAYGLSVALIIVALGIGFLAIPGNRNLGFTLLAYLILTTAYSYKLKYIPVYDIVAVAAGFVLRAVAGAAATNTPISEWFFIVTSFGALLMVVGKREGELKLLENDASAVRKTLGAYTPTYLLYLRSVASGVVMVGYCLWAFESAGKHPDAAIWFELSIVPFVIAILRYGLLLDRGEGAEPEKLILKDRSLLLAGACWALVYAYAVSISIGMTGGA